MSEEPQGFKSGFVAIVGRANAGKSTLVNSILGHKVTIVSAKPQTTHPFFKKQSTRRSRAAGSGHDGGTVGLQARELRAAKMMALARAFSGLPAFVAPDGARPAAIPLFVP